MKSTASASLLIYVTYSVAANGELVLHDSCRLGSIGGGAFFSINSGNVA